MDLRVGAVSGQDVPSTNVILVIYNWATMLFWCYWSVS